MTLPFSKLSPAQCGAGDETVTGLKKTESIPKSLLPSLLFGWQARLAEALQ